MNLVHRLRLGGQRRLPMVLQVEASECGLASLAMVASYFGYQTDLAELRRRYGISLRGATLKDLMRVADEIGFSARPLRLELSELAELRLPCVLHWDLNHFVVLERVSSTHVVVHDPAVGVRTLSLAAVSPHFTGVALELIPTERFRTAPPPPRLHFSQLLGQVKGFRRSLSHLLTLALAIELFAMISPMFLGWVLDQAIVSADRDLLVTLAVAFFLLLVLQTTVSAMRSWVLMGLNASLKLQSRANLFTHLINLSTSFFEARHLGDIISRFGSQETILRALTSDFAEAIMDGLMATLTLLIMFVFAPDLAGIAAFGAVIYAGLRIAFYRPLRQASLEAIVWAARRDSHFYETLRGIRAIKLFNGFEDRRVRWLNYVVETVNNQLVADRLRVVFKSSNALVLGTINILIIYLGARRVLDGGFSIGLLVAFLAYKDRFLGRVSELVNKAVDLSMLQLQAERLSDIVLEKPEASGPWPGSVESAGEPQPVEIRNLSFRYSETDNPVLENLNLKIHAGESVAIVGPSGCGKSTLLKVLSGLLPATSGQVMVGGRSINQIGLHHYRQMFGVVMQDDQLFAGSLRDNICFFHDAPDMERIAQVAKLAAIHDDIVAMPMGYDTLIGDMGTTLSGGQRQRVVLARALYRRPAILLLDEATSNLDVGRERQVNSGLRGLEMTRIVIAHRPETIKACDRVIELGQIPSVPALASVVGLR